VRIQRRRNPASVLETHPLAMLEDITVMLNWDEETQNWVTRIPELNGISTFGKTQEEALNNTRELILGYLDSMQDLRLRVPLNASQLRRLRAALR